MRMYTIRDEERVNPFHRPITIEMIKDVIVKLQVTRNITILISDHAFENVLQIADNIKILCQGGRDGKNIFSKAVSA